MFRQWYEKIFAKPSTQATKDDSMVEVTWKELLENPTGHWRRFSDDKVLYVYGVFQNPTTKESFVAYLVEGEYFYREVLPARDFFFDSDGAMKVDCLVMVCETRFRYKE